MLWLVWTLATKRPTVKDFRHDVAPVEQSPATLLCAGHMQGKNSNFTATDCTLNGPYVSHEMGSLALESYGYILNCHAWGDSCFSDKGRQETPE